MKSFMSRGQHSFWQRISAERMEVAIDIILIYVKQKC